MTSFAFVSVRRLFVVTVALVAASCGDNLKAQEPDAAVDASAAALCGNNVIDTNEDCDDGDQAAGPECDATCHFTCGNGVVEDTFGEVCDPGIFSGDGACPSSCDDGMACTSDLLAGSDCQAQCMNAAITVPANGDGCCPTGGNSTNDDDCAVACGNGMLETGELCDTGIAVGTGSCPTTCDDAVVCTTDALANGGTCQAACSNTPITVPADGDGCCPLGANTGNDNDCQAGCGNMVVDSGETCDTAITVGAGRCPTTCTDGMACTRDVLSNGGTCTAVCTFPAITMPMTGDGCCPAGANNNNDGDCAPVCGNGVTELNEQCDDGNQNDTDTCTNLCRNNVVTTAFKFTDLDLRDPHVTTFIVGCNDVTPHGALFFSVNDELQTSINTDDDGDGLLDLAPTVVFRNFNQTATTQPVEIHFANCTAPESSTTCTAGTQPAVNATATFMNAGQCLTFLSGTVRPYSPAVTATSSPCMVTNAVTVTINLSGIPIVLTDARIAMTYVGNPASATANGLLMGFISEATADATIIPASFPIIGGEPLSSILPGGDGNCARDSDKDTHNGVMGWWFYLNFPTRRVTWTN